MPSIRIDVDHTAWVQVLPASSTAYATLETNTPIRFVRGASAPADLSADGTHVNIHDVIVAHSGEPTWAIATTNAKSSWVMQHDE